MGAMTHVQHKRMADSDQKRGGKQCGDHPACDEPTAPFDGIRAQEQQQENGDMNRREANAGAIGQQFRPEGCVAHQNRPSAGAFQRTIA